MGGRIIPVSDISDFFREDVHTWTVLNLTYPRVLLRARKLTLITLLKLSYDGER